MLENGSRQLCSIACNTLDGGLRTRTWSFEAGGPPIFHSFWLPGGFLLYHPPSTLPPEASQTPTRQSEQIVQRMAGASRPSDGEADTRGNRTGSVSDRI